MKKIFTGIIIGLITGAVATLLVMWLTFPSILLTESKSNHDFQTTTAKIEKSVTDAGWKIPHVNDLQASIKKFGKDVLQVKVYEICQPAHAYKILSQDDERIASAFMPCRIAVYEKSDGSVYLSRMNAGALSGPLKKIIRNTMKDADLETEKIIAEVIRK